MMVATNTNKYLSGVKEHRAPSLMDKRTSKPPTGIPTILPYNEPPQEHHTHMNLSSRHVVDRGCETNTHQYSSYGYDVCAMYAMMFNSHLDYIFLAIAVNLVEQQDDE